VPTVLVGATDVKTGGFFGADRQVIQEDFCPGFLEHLKDFLFGRFRFVCQHKSTFFVIILHVLGKTVQNLAHLYGDTGRWQFRTEHRRAVRCGKNCFVYADAHFALVDIEGRDDFYVTGLISADLPVHQANSILLVLPPVVVNALYQGTGTVSNADNRNLDLAHFLSLR